MKNKIDKEVVWSESVVKAKEILGTNKINQMEIAQLALEACEISWGGAHERGKFTLSRFAKEIGVTPKSLSHWVAVRVSVYDKLPAEKRAKAQFTPMGHVASRVNRDSTPEQVLKIYNEITEASDIDKTMTHYLHSFRSAAHNLVLKGAASGASEKILAEYLFYCGKIVYQIKKDRPDLKPCDNNVASTNGKMVISAAAALLGRDDREKGRDLIKDESGALIRVTPKDRDVIAFLRQQKGWTSPTEIGMKVRGLNSNSASGWAYRTLNKFSGTKLVERNNKGHYRWIGE